MYIWLIVFFVNLVIFIVLTIIFSIEEARQKRFGESFRKKLDLLIISFGNNRIWLGVKFYCGSARLIARHFLRQFLRFGLSLVRNFEIMLKHLSHANTKAARILNKEIMSVMKQKTYFDRKKNKKK